MTIRRPTQVPAQGAHARDLWITISITLPTLVAGVVIETALIVALALALVW